MWLKRFVTNRKFITVVFVLIIASLLLSNFLPRPGSMPNEEPLWYAQFPAVARLIGVLGLNALQTSLWFSLLGFLFFVSLACSTYDQGRRAWQATRQLTEGAGGEGEPLSIPVERFRACLRREGYLPLADNGSVSRHVKAPWGYWGNFLLHLGITLVVLFSYVRVLTEHRTLLRLVEGIDVGRVEATVGDVAGLLAGKAVYPEAVRLERLSPAFWDNDQLKSLDGEVTLIDDQGRSDRIALAAFKGEPFRGQTFYLSPKFGTAFFLQFYSGDAPPFAMILPIGRPLRRDRAGYGETDLQGGRLHLKAKYFADAGKRGMVSSNPLLVLRLYDGDALVQETELRKGGDGALGPYLVRLDDARATAELLAVGGFGVSGIYCGFAVIFIGAVLVYCTTPREVVLRLTGSEGRATWRSVRFRDLYRDEEERIMACCRGEEKP